MEDDGNDGPQAANRVSAADTDADDDAVSVEESAERLRSVSPNTSELWTPNGKR